MEGKTVKVTIEYIEDGDTMTVAYERPKAEGAEHLGHVVAEAVIAHGIPRLSQFVVINTVAESLDE